MEYFITGVDEAGRGPLAGPVVAAAVILNPAKPISGLADSKQLTALQREALFTVIIENAFSFGVGRAEVEEIDRVNILQATFLAMQRAVAALSVIPHLALIDGNRSPKLPCKTKAIIAGDQTEPAISAASILAKVTRDREMQHLDQQFPLYGFAKHKGYSTRDHLLALKQHGPCDIHRRSFAPVTQFYVEKTINQLENS
ncbi:MAG: ribonuclease HII [Gammaproteobacteria bacterium]|nr:ribonuclease HII [Gammaproteobacteria bacterium]